MHADSKSTPWLKTKCSHQPVKVQGGGHRPPRAKVLSMKWVYKKKPEKFKARLVIRGFTQKEGGGTFDPDMVVSPTAHGPSVPLLLAIAVQQGRTVGQFDVSNAFQQGSFLAGEIIYVRMPAISGGGVRKLSYLHRCTD